MKSIERNGEIKTLFPRKLQKPTYLLPLSADSPLQLTKKLSTHTYTHTQTPGKKLGGRWGTGVSTFRKYDDIC